MLRFSHSMAVNGTPSALKPTSRTLEENVRVIKAWEQAALESRSRAERLSGWITSTAGRGWVLLAHVVWFLGWGVVNVGVVPGLQPFDRFPFPMLTTAVSLEAIFLALFVLSSQNRMATQADKRAHLDLQVDLLAEREMTAVLQMLKGIAARVGVEHAVGSPRIEDLTRETDIRELASKLDAELGGGDDSKQPATATKAPSQGDAAGSARSSS
jgi:uncharacterized membrane protein